MEKRIGLVLLLFFLFFNLFAEDIAKKDEKDVIDEMVELKLKEVHLNITPFFKLVIPDTSIKLGLKQKIGDTQLDAETEYNYLYNKINYSIQYRLDFIFSYFLKFYDAINFEQIYLMEKYIQRNKGLILGIKTPVLINCFQIKEELKFDNYYFSKLDDIGFKPDKGNTIFLITWFEFADNFQDENNSKNIYAGINFSKSIASEISFYNYVFMNILFEKKFNFENSFLQFKFEGGYLIENISTPMWEVYKLGSFDKMLGFNFEELQGFYMNFIRSKYEFVINDQINWELLLVLFKRISGFVIFDIGCAGNDSDVTGISNYNIGIGAGLKFDFIFRKRTPVTMTFALGQAIKQGRYPVFYFVHEF